LIIWYHSSVGRVGHLAYRRENRIVYAYLD
jgi:hypothetical protein